MLLGEKLRRRHDGGLVAVLHRQQGGKECDDGLAAADVPLQQTMHFAIAGHVGNDLAQRRRLRVGESERQRILECGGQLPAILECNAAATLPLQGIGAPMQDVDEQQFLEGESCPAERPLGDAPRAMDHSYCFA